MNTYETIDLNDYVQTGEGGTSLTYTHKMRPTMAKLFNLVNEAELAEREFQTAHAVFEMGMSHEGQDTSCHMRVRFCDCHRFS